MPGVGGQLSACLHERKHQIDRAGCVAACLFEMAHETLSLAESNTFATEQIRVHRVEDQRAVFLQLGGCTQESSVQESPIVRVSLVQIVKHRYEPGVVELTESGFYARP